jgi:ketosteroid isomerase-like protein
MGEAEMALLREIYADWERGDYDQTRYLHPDFELVYGSDFLEAGEFRGLSAAADGWRSWTDQWSSWHVRVLEYRELGDRVLALVQVEGIAKTSGLELRAPGPSANLWEFRDGMPWRLTIYTQAATALREAGIDSP